MTHRVDSGLAPDPQRVGSVLLDPALAGVHRAKRGKYVVLYDIDDQQQVVLIRRLEHRRMVCSRPLPS